MSTQPSKPAHAEATPRPWRKGPDDNLIGPLGNTVAEFPGYSTKAMDNPIRRPYGGRESNRELVWEAVNAHEAAVALAEAVLDNLRGFVTESDIDEVLQLARAFEAARKGEA